MRSRISAAAARVKVTTNSRSRLPGVLRIGNPGNNPLDQHRRFTGTRRRRHQQRPLPGLDGILLLRRPFLLCHGLLPFLLFRNFMQALLQALFPATIGRVRFFIEVLVKIHSGLLPLGSQFLHPFGYKNRVYSPSNLRLYSSKKEGSSSSAPLEMEPSACRQYNGSDTYPLYIRVRAIPMAPQTSSLSRIEENLGFYGLGLAGFPESMAGNALFYLLTKLFRELLFPQKIFGPFPPLPGRGTAPDFQTVPGGRCRGAGRRQ